MNHNEKRQVLKSLAAHGREPLLDTPAAAVYLDLSPRTMEKMRHEGRGPAYIRFSSRCVKYPLVDLDAWQSSHRRTTSEMRA